VAAFAYAVVQDLVVYGPVGVLFYRYYTPLHIRSRVRDGWRVERKPGEMRFTLVQPRGAWPE
jgi:hypothetical protein